MCFQLAHGFFIVDALLEKYPVDLICNICEQKNTQFLHFRNQNVYGRDAVPVSMSQ
jgi:hypothetical protein